MRENHPVSRRHVMAVAAGMAVSPSVTWSQAAATYLVLTMATKNFPHSTLASCAELEKNAQHFDAESKRAKAKPDEVGEEYYKRATFHRKELQETIANAKTALANAKLDETFAYINGGVSIALLGLGLFFTGPLGVAVLAGATVLSGVSVFAAQLVFRQGTEHTDFILGYSKGRALMFAELATADAATASGKLVGSGVNAAGYFIAAYEYRESLNNQKAAEGLLKRSLQELELLDKGLGELGTDKKAWAALYGKATAAAHARLVAYIKANKANDCRLLQTSKGPMIIKG